MCYTDMSEVDVSETNHSRILKNQPTFNVEEL